MKLGHSNLTLAIALVACAASSAVFAQSGANTAAQKPDPRLREVSYDPRSVVTVPTKRGEVTLIVLGADEGITDVASGMGGECTKPESAWCIVAHPGGRNVFIKPKTNAQGANNLAIVTSQRTHAIRLTVLADNDKRDPVYRLTITPPPPEPPPPPPPAPTPPSPSKTAESPAPAIATLAAGAAPIPVWLKPAKSPAELLAERLQAKPQVLNTQYTLAEGKASQDILPSMVFDDGRFTYLRFSGNREVPAVFHVQGDGSEALLNTRMDEDLLVVDRVSRRLVLRAGQAVVSIHNEAFDLEGVPPEDGTTVPGIQRVLKSTVSARPTTGVAR